MIRERKDRPFRHATVSSVLAAALVLGLAPAASGQGPGGGPGTPHPQDPLAEHLFPPDLVMRHQTEIGLSRAQRETLIEELQNTQNELVPLQFEVSEAAEALANLLSGSRIDEGQALAQAKRVMELETRTRARHLALLVRIKNLLSPDQQEGLTAIRRGGPG